MKKTSRLLLFSSLLAACSLQAHTTVSFNNFNFRGGSGNGGFGIFGAPSAGVVKTQDLTTYAQGAYTPETDFNFRWSGLTLDGAGTGDDYVDFTLRFTSNGPTAGNVQLGGEGIGVQGGLGIRIDEDDPATTEVNEAEQLVIEVVNVSSNALGTVDFDGFTKAEAFAASGAGLFNVQADVNGITGSLTRNTGAYQFGNLAPAWTGDLQSVTVNNTVHNVGGLNTAVPRILFRQCDFRFTFTETAGAPTIVDFSLGSGGFPTGESQGSYFTTGSTNTEAGVYDQASLEFYYELENVTQATLKRNGDTETVINNPSIDSIVPAVQPPGVYTYTLEVTNGTDTAVSQPITVYIQQPMVVSEFSTRSNASQIGDGAKLPLFLSAIGDFNSGDLSNGLFLTFTDQGETLTEAGAGGTGGDGNLTPQYRLNPVTPLFYSDNLSIAAPGRLDVEVSSIVTAIQTANGGTPLTFPFSAKAILRAVNPAGTTEVDINFTIQDSQIVVELDPANFVTDSGVLENSYISPFVEALDVANGDLVDLTGNGVVTFTSGLEDTISLADEFTGVASYQEGYRFQNVTHSLWIEIPETPQGGGLIIKWGNDAAGTSIGIDNGELVARVQNTVANFMQASAPITAGWHHIAVAVSMGGADPLTNSVALYIDGQLANQSAAPAAVVTSWASNLVGALFGNPGGGGYAGLSAGLFTGGNFTNAKSGVIRMYRGILDAPTIAELATEFLGSPSNLQVVSTSYVGGQFNVTASGLETGTTYYLRRSSGLSGGLVSFTDVASVSAGSDTETLTDATPLAGKAFYVVSDESNPAP